MLRPVPPLAVGSVPVMPVVSGNPVALVNTAADGVPRAGVINVGEVERTFEPEPVDVVTPVPPLTTGSTLINWSALLVATMYHCEPL